jgi:hypothetical protein
MLSKHSRRARRAVIALTAIATTMALLPATATAADAAPTAAEIGVTAKEIHIATLADVDNSLAPGLFKGGVDGVKGAVKYINKNGGIAG